MILEKHDLTHRRKLTLGTVSSRQGDKGKQESVRVLTQFLEGAERSTRSSQWAVAFGLSIICKWLVVQSEFSIQVLRRQEKALKTKR